MRLLSMSGFIPEEICDIKRFNGFSGERNIAHYCGYANDFIFQVINDGTIDGAVFPKSCDSSRIIKSYLEECGKFIFQLNIPARNDDLAVNFFAKEIEQYKLAIEEYFHVSLDRIPERIEKINERNQAVSRIYNEIAQYSYSEYLHQIHYILDTPLMEVDLDFTVQRKAATSKRIYLVGSYLSNVGIAEVIEKNGLSIVGDNLPESGRICNSSIEGLGEDVYKRIAKGILQRRLSPTQNNFSSIIAHDLEEIKTRNADGVIFVTQKYCEPYDYLYSVYKKELDKREIPSLKLTLNDSQDGRKVSLLVEAFADTI